MTFRPVLAAALLASLSPAIAADPVLSNLAEPKRQGTELALELPNQTQPPSRSSVAVVFLLLYQTFSTYAP